MGKTLVKADGKVSEIAQMLWVAHYQWTDYLPDVHIHQQEVWALIPYEA